MYNVIMKPVVMAQIRDHLGIMDVKLIYTNDGKLLTVRLKD